VFCCRLIPVLCLQAMSAEAAVNIHISAAFYNLCAHTALHELLLAQHAVPGDTIDVFDVIHDLLYV